MTHRASFEIGKNDTLDFLIETEAGMIYHSGLEREITPRSMGAEFAAKLARHQKGERFQDCVICQSQSVLDFSEIDPRDPAQRDADLFDEEVGETYADILAR